MVCYSVGSSDFCIRLEQRISFKNGRLLQQKKRRINRVGIHSVPRHNYRLWTNEGKMTKETDELKAEEFDRITLDLASILDRIQLFHSQNGQESMNRIIDSGQGDFNKWPIALVHSVSMKFIIDALGQLQLEIKKIKDEIQTQDKSQETKLL
jgi:hypothetical protein